VAIGIIITATSRNKIDTRAVFVSVLTNFARAAFLSKAQLGGKTCRIRGVEQPCLAGPGEEFRELSAGGFTPDARRIIYVSGDLGVAVGEKVEVDDKGFFVVEAGDIGPGEQRLALEADARR